MATQRQYESMRNFIQDNYLARAQAGEFKDMDSLLGEMFIDAEQSTGGFSSSVAGKPQADVLKWNRQFVKNFDTARRSRLSGLDNQMSVSIDNAHLEAVEPVFQEVITETGFITFDRQVKILQEERGLTKFEARALL